jgi:hypothetical protein
MATGLLEAALLPADVAESEKDMGFSALFAGGASEGEASLETGGRCVDTALAPVDLGDAQQDMRLSRAVPEGSDQHQALLEMVLGSLERTHRRMGFGKLPQDGGLP